VRRLLLLPLLAAIALPAAGCCGGTPSSFADCRDSASRGGDDNSTPVLPQTYDCLVRAYHDDCRPARATIGESGVDTGAEFAVRVYRRGSRCAGDVTVRSFFMSSERKPESFSCRETYLFGGKLSLFGCGKANEFAFSRGVNCLQLRERLRQHACRRAGVQCPPAPTATPARTFRLAC
jgi:hypothetical protein